MANPAQRNGLQIGQQTLVVARRQCCKNAVLARHIACVRGRLPVALHQARFRTRLQSPYRSTRPPSIVDTAA